MSQYLFDYKLNHLDLKGARDILLYGNLIEQECIFTSLEYFKFIQFCAENSINPNTLMNILIYGAIKDHLPISKKIFFPKTIGSHNTETSSLSRTQLFHDEEIDYLNNISSTFNQLVFSEFIMIAQL